MNRRFDYPWRSRNTLVSPAYAQSDTGATGTGKPEVARYFNVVFDSVAYFAVGSTQARATDLHKLGHSIVAR